MRLVVRLVVLIVIVFSVPNSYAQSPIADFSIPDSNCTTTNISFTNSSSNSTSYVWDFCHRSLDAIDGEQVDFTASLTSIPTGINYIYDSLNWYGFVSSRSGNSIIRLDYGASLDNAPTSQTNLGNVGGVLNGPKNMEFYEEGGIWYALVGNWGNGNLIRLTFPTGLGNAPTAQNLGNLNTWGRIRGIDVINIGGDVHAAVSSNTTGDLSIVDFGSSILNNPNGSDVTSISISAPMGIQWYLDDSDIYAFVASSNSISSVYFGSTIHGSPTITGIASISVPTDVRIGIEDDVLNLVAINEFGTMLNIRYPNGVTSAPEVTNFTHGGLMANTFGFDLIYEAPKWIGYAINYSTKQVYRIDFEEQCDFVNFTSSTNVIPSGIQYNTSGTYKIGLSAYNSDGVVDTVSNNITIDAPLINELNFTVDSQCQNILANLTASSDNDINVSSWQWSFGDGNEDSGLTTSNTYASTGEFMVNLIATTLDGCKVSYDSTISIYDVPASPTFSTPAAPYCTGADLVFENLFDESNYSGATLTYDWNYNGEGNSSERDGSFSFETDGTKTITLTASIPGCSTPSAGTDINLIAGPDVNFSFEDLCLGDQTQFTNSTTGTGITGQTWDFGDGSGTSSASSPSYSFNTYGNYNVSLTVNNNQGCSNELIQSINIGDKPIASFNYGPACEGVDIAFEDGSTVGGLANITSYEWDFEGLGSSTNQNPNFTFDNQGSYDVELIVETTAGCRDTVISAVNVLLAPVANFEVDLGCINTETVFLDRSEGDFGNPITQWVWTIDGSLASYSSSFGEVYNDPGEHTISLQVRSANNCQAIHNDTFTISELPVANFTTEKECDNEYTVFQDATASPAADIVSHQWVFDDEHTSSTNPASHLFSNAGNYAVALTVVDEAGCEGSIQKTVTIHPSPQAQLSTNTDIGPAPLTVDFADATQEASTSLWMFGDEQNSTSTEGQPQFTYNEWGDYQAQLITTNDLGCSDTTSMLITVADPILDLELEQISTEESEGKTNITLTVKNNGNIILHGFDIRIDLDNNSSIFEKYSGTLLRDQSVSYPLNFTFSSTENNIGYACITVEDQVDDFNDINIVNNERCIDFNQQLVVENSYPNPVKSTDSKIRVNMILPSDAPVQIFLLDATGAILFQEIYMEARSGLNSFFLDIYSFEQGMYFIKTVYNQQESTQRFVKL